MYHIVFNSNESYIKYLTVLIHSIVVYTNKNNIIAEWIENTNKCNNPPKIPFWFHILTDGISNDTIEKIRALKLTLNKIYPCDFKIYIFCDSIFQGLPKLNGNYLTYFCIKIGNILPNDITICLYLDIDMLCICDIREIFNINLDEKICGVVRNCYYYDSQILHNIDSKKHAFKTNIDTYFNAGFMLTNLDKWRKLI